MLKRAVVENALGVGAVVLVLYVVGTGRRHAGGAPEPALPPSPYAACRRLEAAFRRHHERLGCSSSNWAFGKAICEAPFKQKPACVRDAEKLVECAVGQPDSAWHCDHKDRLALRDGICASAALALGTCMQ
jgi:hypothetical protein